MTVDTERLVSEWLRARPEVAAIVDDRVVTVVPNRAVFPMLRLSLVGGRPVFSQPLYLDASIIQFDAYGGPKAQARDLIDATRSAIDADLPGLHSLGVVTGVEWAEMRYLPDESYDPAQPRFVASVYVYTHP